MKVRLLRIIEILKKHEAQLHIFDPYISHLSNVKDVEEILEKSDALILVTNHDEFLNIPVEKFREHGIKVIIDGRNCLDKDKIQKLGIIYKGIGR